MIKKRRHIWNNKHGISSVIETVIATAIIFTVLALFYSSINSLYHVHVRADIDLQVKCNDICEMFISSPGKSSTYIMNWEDAETDAGCIGLAATPTIAYGTFETNIDGEITEINEPIYDFFNHSVIGNVTSSCFLAGTEIITADGSYMNIEDVEVGDMVKSFDVETGNIVNRRVINVFYHSPKEMTECYLVINDFLKVTPNHLLYSNGQWIFFDQVTVEDVINDVFIYSVEKVFERVPTFDLGIEKDHNYFVRFSDDSFLVHNADPDIDSDPWVATSKDAFLQRGFENDFDFESFGGGYYVEYVNSSVNPGIGVYEVKGETGFVYPVLDSQKIDALFAESSKISYDEAKTILGFVDEYKYYDFNVTLFSVTYSSPVPSYGAAYDFADVIVSTTRNVLIYFPPEIDSDGSNFVAPSYEIGQITIRMFLGGYVPSS